MESAIVIVHVLAAIGITGLVLMQHGKGADMGASFGSGASQTIFGSTGSGNALTQSTTWLATIFFVTSLALAFLAKQQAGQSVQDSSLLANPSQIETLLKDTPEQTGADATGSDVPQVPGQAAAGDIVDSAVVQATADATGDAAAMEAAAQDTSAEAVETLSDAAPENSGNAAEDQ